MFHAPSFFEDLEIKYIFHKKIKEMQTKRMHFCIVVAVVSTPNFFSQFDSNLNEMWVFCGAVERYCMMVWETVEGSVLCEMCFFLWNFGPINSRGNIWILDSFLQFLFLDCLKFESCMLLQLLFPVWCDTVCYHFILVHGSGDLEFSMFSSFSIFIFKFDFWNQVLDTSE